MYVGFLICVCAFTFQWSAVFSEKAKRPHIIFVMADDLGWSDIGYHNISSAVKTPNIDRLARAGMKFTNYYVQAVCTPSRGALMTGKYPIHIGMQHFVINSTSPWGMPKDVPTLPEKLRQLGYSTNLVGKWHLGFFDWDYVPTARGFDTFLGIFMGEGDFWNHTKYGYLDMRRGKEPTWSYTGKHSTDVFTQEAIDIVNRHDQQKPLYLLLSYTAPHTPLQAPQTDIDKYKSVVDMNRRIYLAMIDGVDQGVGKLVDACKRKGMWNDTLFVFVSDNGGHPGFGGGYNWPLRGYKSTLWEGGVRVPGFVLGSMIQKSGGEINDLIHVTDWYPTLIKLAGGTTKDDNIDGVDQWDVLSKGTPSTRQEILVNIDYAPDLSGEQYSPRGFTYYSGAAIRVGDMKLLHKCPNGSWYKLPEDGNQAPTEERFTKERIPYFEFALYNVTADPEERYELSTQYPDIVEKLFKRLKYYNSTAVKSRLQPEDPESLRIAAKYGRWEPWKNEGEVTSTAGSIYCWLTSSHWFIIYLYFFVN
ncbi:arylsulfatase J isoform X1 [Exaiptasia diaphana]|uniref:Sulfatase N-terminal domain-containing protein n=1 Tax=Exaiptasia diaphana TaxID=2652724 RepID=A0A913X6J1_EXADI|nr:arylsulfatase J isoform X1 [Exaiptasia diaphana]